MRTAILFELHHLGDAVLSVPFLRAMSKKENRQAHVVCRKSSVEIFHKFLHINQIHIWEPWWELTGSAKRTSFLHLPGFIRQLRSLQPEEAFCAWADSRIHWLMQLTGAPIRVGFPVNAQNFYAHQRPWRWRRMILGRFLGWFVPLSLPQQRKDYQQLHLDDWRQLAEAAKLPWDSTTPWFDIPLHPLAESHRQPGKKLWLIHPGGRLITKRWPLERFQQLLETFFRDLLVILIVPPDSPALISHRPNHISVSPRDVDELLSLVDSADAVLCNDSLVSHLAAAQGKLVWTIFGSANPSWFAPFQNSHRVIASHVCAFRPCIDRCVYSSPICLEAVSVKQVSDSISQNSSLPTSLE